MSHSKNGSSLPAIAVIGMSGRFPGAHNVREFWWTLQNGVESISRFTAEELELNEDAALIHDPRYVKSKGIVDGVELFDAPFFGFTPREAELADPQQRLFLECAWEALEDAGYDAQQFQGSIGVFGGSSFNHYLFANLLSNRELINSNGLLQTSIRNRTDHLTTNVAYKLNLKGPAVTVQTACSTSLVAVHLAAQSLLHYECDMALAGGSSISLPQKTGYMYEEGGILSPDGYCRAFDAKAQGTVTGNGVGIVVLKRLEDALADRDHIEAVILGSAIGNDGSGKVGYTAPSIEGQAHVIAEAQLVAGVDPQTITYVEAHGTGTKMGDPIELSALKQVFTAKTSQKGFCAIGSVKTNIGHLDAAAGIAGLIKTVLSLKHRILFPSLHFEQPNPEIDFAGSPFFVNAQVRDWESQGTRRAGVSSFGIGGTNAHVVLQEAPPVTSGKESRGCQLLLLSAKTSTALESLTANLATHLESHNDLNLADAAYTLQCGRREFNHRRAVVCRDVDDAIQALCTLDPRRTTTGFYEPKQRPLVFMFPGQGAQYVNMTRGLYASEPAFRARVDQCSALLQTHLGFDLREMIYPASENDTAACTKRLMQTEVTQPALFVVEYALAGLWMEWGIKPQSMIGHSIGEYVAACLAGVFSLEDALTLVAARGLLMQTLPDGGMLVVPLPEPEILPLLKNGLSLAAVNGPAFCVVSGPNELIAELDQELAAKAVACRRLSTSHAFHSPMMEPILDQFRTICRNVRFHAPHIPYLSNLSGTWITEAQACSPDYWVRHLRETVRFSDALRELVKDPDRVLLEVGPGRTLATLARWNPYRATGQVVLNSVRHLDDSADDEAFLLTAVGKLWLAGVRFNWSGFYQREQRIRISLPTYPFEVQRYWIDAQKHADSTGAHSKLHKRPDIAEWFYVPSWKRIPLAHPDGQHQTSAPWLLFCDRYGVGAQLANQLQARGIEVFTIVEGRQFASHLHQWTIRPQSSEDYQAVLHRLNNEGKLPSKIVHLWNIAGVGAVDSLEASFYSPLFLAKAMGELRSSPKVELLLVSNFLYDVCGNMVLNPQRATLTGPCRVISQEYPNIICRHIDLDLDPNQAPSARLLPRIIAEFDSGSVDKIVAYRNAHRWVQTFESLRVPPAPASLPLRAKGTYLITGGLGGIGLVVAEQFAQAAQARLVLVGRSEFPQRERWEEWLEAHHAADPVSAKIRKLQRLESMGAEVMVASADVSDQEQMRTVIAGAQVRFGSVRGVVHAAGVPGGGVIQLKTVEIAEKVLAPKVKGTLVLASLFRDLPLDFFVACSSRSAILGGFGQVDYCAANAFLDAFAHYSHSVGAVPMTSVDWDGWQAVGMLVNKAAEAGLGASGVSRKTGHPLLDSVTVESPDREVYTTTFSPLTHWVLDEHRIVGNAVIPGVAYLEMARAASEKFADGQTIEIRDAFFLAPLGFRDDEKREVKLILEKQDNGCTFRVVSRLGEEDDAQEWNEYSTGKVAFVPPAPTRKHDINAIIERCNLRHVVLTDDSKRDEDLGPRWQALKRAFVGDNELLSYLELPEQFAPELEKLKLHPSLLDRATGTGKEFLIREGVFLPMGYRRLRIHRALERVIYVHIRFRTDEDSKRQTITFDVTFMNQHGEELLDIEAFAQKRINDITGQIKVSANRQYRRGEEPVKTVAAGSAQNGVLAGVYAQSLQQGITPSEGKTALQHVLALKGQPQIIVSTRDLHASIAEARFSKPLAALVEQASQETTARLAHPRPELPTAFVPPSSEMEKKIAEVWQRILGMEQVGIHDNFFELGGDSVQAIQIITQTNQKGFHLTPQQLFQHQTIAELAAAASGLPVAQAQERKSAEAPSQPPSPPESKTTASEVPATHEFTPADFPLANLDKQGLLELELALAGISQLSQDTSESSLSSSPHGTASVQIQNGHCEDHAQLEETLRQHGAVSDALVTEDADFSGQTSAYVVLKSEYARPAEPSMKFGLFFFGDDNSIAGADKYRLYLEAAKSADRLGFSSVWTPERHFHQKGGLYPNPSVLSAALAVATEQIQLRAGSVVMPLHNPLRVAEEWSIVDNLSRGRVGISFVSGWVANDFAFFPERFANKRAEMFRGIEEVQRLWRGHKISTRDGAGNMTEIEIFPKPIQQELPVWLTCSGREEMFIKAGELGLGVLTSLQEQNIDEAAARLKTYRQARASAGFDPAAGHVTMMMHTFMGDEKAAVIDKVRGPLSRYLRSHIDLIKTSAAHKAEAQKKLPNAEVVDSLVAFAFERYCRTASLIGTPEDCLPMVERLKAIGVSEVACLIDFGVDVESSLESLRSVNALRQQCASARVPDHGATLRAELMALLRSRVSSAAIPNSLLIVDELPAKNNTRPVHAMV